MESSIEYLRGMQVVKAFKQEGVSIAGIRKAYNDSKKINIKIEVEYMPFNCLHLFSLKAASIAIVAVAAMLTYNGSMELPTMLMLDMFSFMIFGSVEAMNNAAHVLEVIDATLDKLDGIEHADIIDKDGKDISLQNTDIAFRDVTFSYDKVYQLFHPAGQHYGHCRAIWQRQDHDLQPDCPFLRCGQRRGHSRR